jgi:hypothetical protein
MIGWGNVAATQDGLRCSFGYIGGRKPRSAAFRAGLEAELARMRIFLGMAG